VSPQGEGAFQVFPDPGELRPPPPATHRSGEVAFDDFLGDSGEGPLDDYRHRSGEGPLPGTGAFPAVQPHPDRGPDTGRYAAAPGRDTTRDDERRRASRRYRDRSSRHSGRSDRRERSREDSRERSREDSRERSRERRSRRSRHRRGQSDRGRITKFGPYTLLKRLGKGSHGYVYLAQREGQSKKVALKFMRSRMLKHREALERFKREADLAGKLKHPGVLNVVDSGEENGQLWYAMEYCSGHTLQEYLQRLPMEPNKARKLVAKLARTVAYAHEQGIIHRDLKPSNILLDPETNHPRITDFGLAKDRWEDSELTQAGEQIGTPIYMSPEQFRGQDVDHRADIYSLGVILYECLTGRPPYEATTTPEVAKLVLAGKAVRPSANVPDVPMELEKICLKAMSKEWVNRYGKAAELAEALEKASGRHEDEESRRVGLIPLAITMTFVGLAAGIVGWTWFDSRRSRRPRPAPTESPQASTTRRPLDRPISPARGSPLDRAEQTKRAELRRVANEKLQHAIELSLAELPFDQNLTAFDEAVALSQHDGELRARAELERAQYLFRRGRFERCNRAAAVLSRRGDRLGYQARFLEALSDLWRGRSDYALTRLEQLWKDDGEGAVGLNAGALFQLHGGEGQEAQELARKSLEADPDYLEARFTLAMALVDQDRPSQALAELRQAVERAPDHPRAYLARAQALEAMRRGDKAYDAYSRLIALTEPEPPDLALRKRAALACKRGRARQALRDTQRLIKRDPLDTEARLWAGVAWELQGKPSKAIDSWKIAHEVGPREFEALLQSFDTQTAVRIRAAVLGD
jgi:serine/threonine protein kinase/Flp pilus assembly protein TadD